MSRWLTQEPSEARRLLAKGGDPAEQVKLDKITANIVAANMFKAVAEEWYAKAEKEWQAPATLNKMGKLSQPGFVSGVD